MPPRLSAEFDTRRDAEMAIEHIVQEYGIDRSAVTVVSASTENTAGTKASGSDIDNGGGEAGAASKPALTGRVKVSVEADSGSTDKVLASFATYHGRQVD